MNTSGLADFAPKSILALGAEPQRALAALIEPVEDIYRLVAWQTVELPAQARPGECTAALVRAVKRLESQLSISLWDAEQDRPRLLASDPALAEGVGHAVAVADLLPPLRVWMAGLSGGGSLAAGQEALAGALCNLIAAYRPGPHQSAGDLARELQTLRPDALLIVGGYERMGRRSREQVLALSRLVTDAAAPGQEEDRPLFCFAGSSQAADEALAFWQSGGGGAVARAANVISPADRGSEINLQTVLNRHHWQRSLDMPAMRRIAGWIQRPVELRSTQWAFANAVRLWMRHHRLPALHGLYAGADRWLHVWASELSGQDSGGVRICCARPGQCPEFLVDWPPLRLVSGAWPAQWPRPVPHWWDPLGLVPVVFGAGQAAPEAALQVLAADILEEPGADFISV